MSTFMDELESVVDEVSSWAVSEIEQIIKALAPDGRPFGTQLKSEAEMLEEYRLIRNDPMAWEAWIGDKAIEIANTMAMSGVTPETIEAVNPVNVASTYLLNYSAKMEAILEKKMV